MRIKRPRERALEARKREDERKTDRAREIVQCIRGKREVTLRETERREGKRDEVDRSRDRGAYVVERKFRKESFFHPRRSYAPLEIWRLRDFLLLSIQPRFQHFPGNQRDLLLRWISTQASLSYDLLSYAISQRRHYELWDSWLFPMQFSRVWWNVVSVVCCVVRNTSNPRSRGLPRETFPGYRIRCTSNAECLRDRKLR